MLSTRLSPHAASGAAVRLTWLAVSLTLVCACPTGAQEADRARRVHDWVEKIARGDEVEAASASERLIADTIEPLASALDGLAQRPPAEQLRLRAALSSISAALRVRIFRSTLEGSDADLFDAFQGRYPELVRQLFDDDYRRRIAALRQLPLERDTGVGVLVAAKVDDYDAEVADAAFEVASRLNDAALARGLTRYVRDATEAIRNGLYGPAEEDIVIVLTKYVRESIRAIGAAEHRDAAPIVADALRFHTRGKYRGVFEPEVAIDALARLGDPATAPALLEFLDDDAPLRSHAAAPGRLATEVLGDRALRSLLQLFGLDLDQFGMFVTQLESGEFAGFLDDPARQKARREFRIWLRDHAEPSGARTQPASAPNPPERRP